MSMTGLAKSIPLARRKPRSKSALCAMSGDVPTKVMKDAATRSMESARSRSRCRIPVRDAMKGLMRRWGLTSVSKVSSVLPPWNLTAPISMMASFWRQARWSQGQRRPIHPQMGRCGVGTRGRVFRFISRSVRQPTLGVWISVAEVVVRRT